MNQEDKNLSNFEFVKSDELDWFNLFGNSIFKPVFSIVLRIQSVVHRNNYYSAQNQGKKHMTVSKDMIINYAKKP